MLITCHSHFVHLDVISLVIVDSALTISHRPHHQSIISLWASGKYMMPGIMTTSTNRRKDVSQDTFLLLLSILSTPIFLDSELRNKKSCKYSLWLIGRKIGPSQYLYSGTWRHADIRIHVCFGWVPVRVHIFDWFIIVCALNSAVVWSAWNWPH